MSVEYSKWLDPKWLKHAKWVDPEWLKPTQWVDPEWSSRFSKNVNSTGPSRCALQNVLQYMDETTLLGLLYFYAESGQVWPQVLSEGQAFISRLKKVSQALDKILVELKKLRDHSPMLQVTVLPTLSDAYHLQSERHIEEYAASLHEMVQVLKRLFSGKRKGRNEEFLVMLWLTIKAKSGRPHWGDLAYLLDAAFYASDINEHFDRDMVEAIVKRFQNDYPKAFDFWVSHTKKSNPFAASLPSPSTTKSPPIPARKRRSRKRIKGADSYWKRYELNAAAKF